MKRKTNYEREFTILYSQIKLVNYMFEQGRIIQAYKLSKLLEERYE